MKLSNRLTNSPLFSNGDFTDLCKNGARPTQFFSGLQLAYPLKNPGAAPAIVVFGTLSLRLLPSPNLLFDRLRPICSLPHDYLWR